MALQLGPCMVLMAGLHNGTASFTGTIDADDTTIPFTAASGTWPDRGVFQLESELILYMEKDDDANVFRNCLRGFKGTTAAAHDGSGDPLDITLQYSDLGKTEGGVTVAASESTVQLRSDQSGETPEDEVVSGTPVTITLNLADITLDNFAMVHKSTVEGTAPNRKVVVYANVGKSLKSMAKKALIVPYAGEALSNDVEDIIVVPQAGIKAAEELVYNFSDQRVIRVELTAYPDTAGRVLIFGDENA